MPPQVSVIIPTYNRGPYIAEAIRSAQAQAYANVEIIVADDGSTDETAEIAAGFGDAITCVHLPHSGQPAVTRNRGLEKASGELIAFLDSDDQFLPNKLTLQVAALAEHPEAGCVYSNGHFFRDDPAQSSGYVLDGMPTPSGEILGALLRGNFLVPSVVLVRRTCLEAVGLFDEDPALFVAEDYELWLRVATHVPVIYAPGTVAAIRRHGESISRDVAALRGCALLALAKLEGNRPDLRLSYATAFNEGYARNHGAIALAHLQHWQITRGLSHALRALRYSLRTPGLGTKPLLEWARRRRVRGTAAMP